MAKKKEAEMKVPLFHTKVSKSKMIIKLLEVDLCMLMSPNHH